MVINSAEGPGLASGMVGCQLLKTPDTFCSLPVAAVEKETTPTTKTNVVFVLIASGIFKALNVVGVYTVKGEVYKYTVSKMNSFVCSSLI